MILSNLPSPAEASSQNGEPRQGFAQAGNRFPLFGIMLYGQGLALFISIEVISPLSTKSP